MGYHLRKIKKGKYGKISKIREEFEEFLDAHEQDNNIMELVELSDIIGAISGYLLIKYKGKITMADLLKMALVTGKAFKDGSRQ